MALNVHKTQTPLSFALLGILDIPTDVIKQVEPSPGDHEFSYLVVAWVLIGVQEEAGVDLRRAPRQCFQRSLQSS